MINLTINGKVFNVDVEPDTPLLWAIREEAGLTGTKFGCGIGQCGACTVLANGSPLRSCSISAAAAAGFAIETIEGLSEDGQLNPVQQAWLEHDVPQCGYCQSGQIMAATAIIRQSQANGLPASQQDNAVMAAQMSNICRCGTYNRIRPALERALELAYKA